MRAKEFEPNILVIFDIDDTLVNTQTEVHVVKDGKVVNSLNSHDFTHYKLQPGESFDFENFRNAREFFEKSKPIIPMMNQLKRDIARGNDVVMVTARADFDDKELFLDTFRKYGIDIDKVHVHRAGNLPSGSTEERKKKIIKMLLDKKDYTKAIMYDDAIPNLQLFVSLKKEHPNTNFYAWHVSLEGNASEYMRENVESSLNETIPAILIYVQRVAKLVEMIFKGQPIRISSPLKTEAQFIQRIKDSFGGQNMNPTRQQAKEIAEKIREVKQDPKPAVMNAAKRRIEEIVKDIPKLEENFADGKVKGKSRPGRVKKAGASCKGSVTSLRKKAAKYSGEKGKMYHWCANMKGGKK